MKHGLNGTYLCILSVENINLLKKKSQDRNVMTIVFQSLDCEYASFGSITKGGLWPRFGHESAKGKDAGSSLTGWNFLDTLKKSSFGNISSLILSSFIN